MKNIKCINSFVLHVLAMALMLCDHIWGTLLPQYNVLTLIGRIAYPIFAFMLVEGYFHTHNLKKYLLRMFLFALLTEIPFNYMMGGNVLYPMHQNVMFTFILGLLGMLLTDKARAIKNIFVSYLACTLIFVVFVLLGFACFVDYYGAGVFLIFVFYWFRGNKWYHLCLQAIGMYIVNISMLGGYMYVVEIFGKQVELQQQAFAMLALIPIWLYNGKQGYHKKWFQYFCYAFYPAHIAILVLIGFITL